MGVGVLGRRESLLSKFRPTGFIMTGLSESVSTGLRCVLGFGAGFEIALELLKLQ